MIQHPRTFNPPSLDTHYTLISTDSPTGRFYTLPTSTRKFYSVTTVLAKTADKSGLVEWRKRVGDSEANRISKEATTVGTKLHSLMESLVKNQWSNEHKDPELVFRFQKIKSFLEDDISEVLGSELQVFSNTLGIAGTTDLVYRDKQNKVVVADLKTSRTLKKQEYIQDYFLQLAAYAICLFEQFNLESELGLILMSLPDGSFHKFYIDPMHYSESLSKRICSFHSLMEYQE